MRSPALMTIPPPFPPPPNAVGTTAVAVVCSGHGADGAAAAARAAESLLATLSAGSGASQLVRTPPGGEPGRGCMLPRQRDGPTNPITCSCVLMGQQLLEQAWALLVPRGPGGP